MLKREPETRSTFCTRLWSTSAVIPSSTGGEAERREGGTSRTPARLSSSNRSCRLDGEVADENCQPSEQLLFVRSEQVVAPGDRVTHRALAVGEIPRTTGEQAQPFGEVGQEGRWREDVQAGGGELDCERQTVK